jgi:hypothetical protein
MWTTSHVWRNSSGIELTLDMRFDAWSDSATDVLNPLEKLVAMYSPIRDGLFLQPPGPTPAQYFSNNLQMMITVMIGNALTIDNLIPTTLGWEFENRFDTNGNPMCALVQANFISYVIPSMTDILKYFKNQTGVSDISGAAQDLYNNANASTSASISKEATAISKAATALIGSSLGVDASRNSAQSEMDR